MTLRRVGAVYVLDSTFEERAIPKAAGFRWHHRLAAAGGKPAEEA